MKSVKNCFTFDSLQVAAFGEDGEQIPELQVSLWVLWCKHAESMGYNPDGLIIETQSSGNWKVVKNSAGEWIRIHWPPQT